MADNLLTGIVYQQVDVENYSCKALPSLQSKQRMRGSLGIFSAPTGMGYYSIYFSRICG